VPGPDAHCDEICGMLARDRLVLTELSTHLQGQRVAVRPAYNKVFETFVPEAVRSARAGDQWEMLQ
jgi:hypothetical protein